MDINTSTTEQVTGSNVSLSVGFFEIGKAYFIRTVTYHLVGRVSEIKGSVIKLQEASFVADSGRFGKAINTGTLEDVEKIDDCIFVNADSVTDFFNWSNPLPIKTK